MADATTATTTTTTATETADAAATATATETAKTVGGGQAVAVSSTESENAVSTPDAQAGKTGEKTFTQAEVNALIEKRIAREKSSKDNEAMQKITALENKLTCIDSGVSKDSVDDVIALAGRYMSDKTDFAAAVKKVLEKYPSFAGKETKPKITTGVSFGGSAPAASGVEAAFLAKNPEIKIK